MTADLKMQQAQHGACGRIERHWKLAAVATLGVLFLAARRRRCHQAEEDPELVARAAGDHDTTDRHARRHGRHHEHGGHRETHVLSA